MILLLFLIIWLSTWLHITSYWIMIMWEISFILEKYHTNICFSGFDLNCWYRYILDQTIIARIMVLERQTSQKPLASLYTLWLPVTQDRNVKVSSATWPTLTICSDSSCRHRAFTCSIFVLWRIVFYLILFLYFDVFLNKNISKNMFIGHTSIWTYHSL